MKFLSRHKFIFQISVFFALLSQPSFAWQDCERSEYGDVNFDGDVTLDDILCILQGFAGEHDCAPLSAQDISPCSATEGPIGDGVVNLNDLLASLQAFSGTSDCVGPCISCTNNQIPVANGGPDRNGQVGATLFFDASESSDPNGNFTLRSYWWNFGDGIFTGWQDSPTITHIYVNAGSYPARLWVRDQCDAISLSDSIQITISNNNPCIGNTAPSANAGPNQFGQSGVLLNFNGSQSSDVGGAIISYQWNFGDGITATGMIVNHSYATTGVFTVTLTVTDNCNATSVDIAIVNIANPNQAPIVNAGPDQIISMPLSGNANATLTGSYVDDGLPVGGPVTVIWSLVSGPAPVNFTNPLSLNSNVLITTPGIYNLRLTVFDGALIGSEDIRITVNPNVCANNSPPTANAGADTQGVVGGDLFFNAAASWDLNGTIQSYFWSFGDGQTATGMVANHTYNSPGIYTVALTVTDNCNATHSDQLIATINHSSGELHANFKVYRQISSVNGFEQWVEVLPNETIEMNDRLKIDATSSTGAVHFYSWQMGDGTFNSGPVIHYDYGNLNVYDGFSQSYTITMTVFDSSFVGFDIFSRTISVVSTMGFLDGLPIAGNNANDIAIDGNRAYTSHNNNVLTAIDISNPSNLQKLSEIYAPVGRAIAAANGHVYLCSGTQGLNIYQGTSTPLLVTNYNTAAQDSQRAQDAFARGKVVFLAAGVAGLKILNMNNPASPTVLGSQVLPGNTSADWIVVVDGKAYIANNTGKVYVFDVSMINVNNPTPASPILIGTISVGWIVHHLSVFEDRLVLHAPPDGLFFYDVSNPANAVFLGSYDISSDAVGLSPSGLVAIENRAYVSFGQVLGIGSAIARVNMVDPANAYVMEWFSLSAFQLSNVNRGPVIFNGKILVANGMYTAVAIDITEDNLSSQ